MMVLCMPAKTSEFYLLLEAICASDLKEVNEELAKNRHLYQLFSLPGKKGPLSFLQFAFYTRPINTAIIEALLDEGVLPTEADMDVYTKLAPEVKALLPQQKIADAKQKAEQTSKKQFTKLKINKSEIYQLWGVACKHQKVALSDFLLSTRSMSSSIFEKELAVAEHHNRSALIESFLSQPLLTIRNKRALWSFAAENGHHSIAEKLVAERQPKNTGFVAALQTKVSSFFTDLWYGNSATPIKKAFLTAVQKKDAKMVAILLRDQKITFSKRESENLLKSLFEGNIIPSENTELAQALLNDNRFKWALTQFPLIRLSNLILASEDTQLLEEYIHNPLFASPQSIEENLLSPAIANGNFKIVKSLMDKEAQSSIADKILVAVASKQLAMVKLLLPYQRAKFSLQESAMLLEKAFANNDKAIINELLACDKVTLNENAAHSPLSVILKDGEIENIQKVITHFGWNADQVKQNIYYPAVKNGFSKTILSLTKHNYVNPAIEGKRALELAVKEGNLAIVKLLAADGRVNPEAKLLAKPEVVAFRWALREGYIEVAEKLNQSKTHLLILAVGLGYEKTVSKLLLAPEKIDGDTMIHALFLASEKGGLNIVKILLKDRRIDTDSVEMIRNAVIRASRNGHLTVIKTLLEYSCLNDTPVRDIRADAFLEASKNGHLMIVESLLKDTRLNRSEYYTAIMEASTRGHFEVVKALLQDPAINQSHVDVKAYRRIFLDAASKGHLEMVQILLRNRYSNAWEGEVARVVRVALSEVAYVDALITASKNGHLTVVNALLEDSEIKAALHINAIKDALLEAVQMGQLKVVQTLIKKVSPVTPEEFVDMLRTAIVSNRFEIFQELLLGQFIDVKELNKQENKAARKELFFEAAKRKDSGFIKLLFTLLAEDKLQTLYGDVKSKISGTEHHYLTTSAWEESVYVNSSRTATRRPGRLENEIECLNSLLQIEKTPEFKTDNNKLYIKINSHHLVECAELIQEATSETEMRTDLCKRLQYGKSVEVLRKDLNKAAKILYPLIVTAKELLIKSDGDKEVNNIIHVDIKSQIIASTILSELVPFIPQKLAYQLFASMSEHMRMKSPKWVEKSVEAVLELHSKAAVEVLMEHLTKDKAFSDRWFNKAPVQKSAIGIGM